ncbi:MAG: class I SAM-dependent methyltransferase [Candidatus Magasanikbacteria bacterium]|nr:class I SAM-dependent methyltransferase [Candidatus Magasanikbacteria bacterium]
MSDHKFELQAGQYAFPYHFIVDLQQQKFVKTLPGGLSYLNYMSKVIELVKKYATSTMLDIGCGDGFLLTNLTNDSDFDNKIQALGVDLDERPIKFAQAFSFGRKVVFKAADIKDLTQSFNLISVVETLEHISDELMPAFLQNIDRLLAPGGTLIISVPSQNVPVISKHYRHYVASMLTEYFPHYQVLETHYMCDDNNFWYKIIQKLLCNQKLNLNYSIFRKFFLRLNNKYFAETTKDKGSHVLMVFKKI